MHRSSCIVASALGLTLTLTACGGHNISSLPELSGNGSGTVLSTTRSSLSSTPLISIPQLFGDLAYTDAGRRAANAPVRVTLTLRYNHQEELDRLVWNLSDPHSGLRPHFLTGKEFDAYYAPTPQQEESVVRALQRAGFKIVQRYPNRTIVDAVARSAAVELFFSTEMHTVHQGKYGDRYTNLKPASVPETIASFVRDVSLDNLVFARTMIDAEGVTAAQTSTLASARMASPTVSRKSLPSTGCNNAAADNGPLASAYGTLATGVAKPFDFPVQHGCNGAGYTAAIAIDDPVNTSYVSTYLSASAVTETGTITNEAVDGGGSGDDSETDLDVETIAGLAPGANIIVYDMGSLMDQSIIDTYNRVLTDGKASAVNSSIGQCETSSPSFDDSTNMIAEQGAAKGVEFSAAAGDNGSVGYCGTSASVSAPAVDPYFLAVGGIDFTDTYLGVLLTVTMGSAYGHSGGGGVSTVFALPSYQHAVNGIITSGRNVPDISLPFYPVALYTGGAWYESGGTSWASPASVAWIIEASELHNTKLGWVDLKIYRLYQTSNYKFYTPCMSGSNGAYSCNPSKYNQAAGIGAPMGWALAFGLFSCYLVGPFCVGT